MVKILDKEFVPYINKDKIALRTKELAYEISEKYKGKNPVFVSVLNGAYVFTADLLKEVNIPCQVEFIKVKSYQGTKSTGNVEWLLDLTSDLNGRDIILVEDIIDTGLTLKSILGRLKLMSPKSVSIATLFFKKDSFAEDYDIDYIGFDIENKFIVGYGLDYEEYGRNLKEIYILK